jgi:hypothetical protein
VSAIHNLIAARAVCKNFVANKKAQPLSWAGPFKTNFVLEYKKWLPPEFCNENGTATEKAFKIESFITQRYFQINTIFFRCDSVFVASYFKCKI